MKIIICNLLRKLFVQQPDIYLSVLGRWWQIVHNVEPHLFQRQFVQVTILNVSRRKIQGEILFPQIAITVCPG